MSKEGERMKNLLILILVTMVGCATVGRKVDQSAVEKIIKGETSRSEVIGLIGSPDRIIQPGNGDTIFSYGYTRVSAKATSFIPIVGAFAGGANVQNQMVMITFDKDGIVKNIMNTYGSTETDSGVAAGGKAKIDDVEQNKREK
jgi:outer membrane protein assembly factor BamE (lipoprotein component of BamABCDE complex)